RKGRCRCEARGTPGRAEWRRAGQGLGRDKTQVIALVAAQGLQLGPGTCKSASAWSFCITRGIFMRWQSARRSENVEDRRSMSAGGMAMTGGIGSVIVVIIALL